MIWFAGFWILTLVVKVGLSTLMPLAPDEAYYWVWSQAPQLSYFDHPGMVAWLFRLGQVFSFLPQGERIPAIFLNHSLLIIWYFILRSLWNDVLTKRWLILVVASPALGIGSILVTPDSPVLFFVSLSILFFIQLERTLRWYWAALLGLSLGLGFCSKYHIVLLALSFLAYVTTEGRWSRFNWRLIGITIGAGLAGCAPVLVWNYLNDFASFRFQLNHGLGAKAWNPSWTADYLVGQLLVFFPSFLFLFLKGGQFRQLRLFFWVGSIPWLFFFFSSLRGSVEANWPMVGYHAAMVLVVASAKSWNHLKAVTALWLALGAIALPLWIWPLWESGPDKLTEVHQIRSHIEDLRAYQPLYGGSYQIASELWYYSGQPVYKLNSMSRPDYFDHLAGSKPTRPQFFVFREINEPLPKWLSDENPHVAVVQTFDRYEVVEVHP